VERQTCFCGKQKRDKDLLCPRCFELYKKEAPKLIAQGKALDVVEWTKEKVQAKMAELEPLQKQLREKEAEYMALRTQVRQEAFQKVRETLKGKRVPDEVREAAEREVERGLWQRKGGNRLYAQRQTLKEEVENKTAPLRETLQQIEEIEKERGTKNMVTNLLASINIPSNNIPSKNQ